MKEEGLSGLSNAVVGVGFIVEARDKFGNLSSGSSTANLEESGNGMSDAFLVSLAGPYGNAHEVHHQVRGVESARTVANCPQWSIPRLR